MRLLILALPFLFPHLVLAQILSTESLQLSQLINKSEIQIQQLKEMLTYAKKDSASLEKASVILQDLTSGIDKSIEKYQGTAIYEKALLQLQAKDDFKKTYTDSQQTRAQAGITDSSDKEYQDIIQFQKESVQANQSDLNTQGELQNALKSAQQGFIPKIQAQAQLGDWQANTRVSAQMTELLAAVHAVREELRAIRMKEEGSGAISTLIAGSEMQNQKQKRKSGK